MGGKRLYNLQNQRLIRGQENVWKMCCCIFLVLFVICGLIGLTAFIVKNVPSISKDKHDPINYHAEGNNQNSGSHDNFKQHPNIKTNYISTTEDNNKVATSHTAEFTATSIESPLSTSTMSSKDIPTRFLTVSTMTYSSSDNEKAGSTNYDVRLTNKNKNVENTFVKRSTKSDFVSYEPTTKLDDNIGSSSMDRATRSDFMTDKPNTRDDGNVDSSRVKRSTKSDFVSAEPITPDDDLDLLLQWTAITFNKEQSVEGKSTEKLTDTKTTPTTSYDFQLNDQICNTNLCKQSTSRMVALMNHSADPCDDFYSYACGGFDINHFKEFSVDDNVLESMSGIIDFNYRNNGKDFMIFDVLRYINTRLNSALQKIISRFFYKLCQL